MRFNIALGVLASLLAWTIGSRASPAAAELKTNLCRLPAVSAPTRCSVGAGDGNRKYSSG